MQSLPRPFFVLAPMDDVTDTVFRQIVADCARPDLFFTEFVNVDGLQSPGRDKLLKKLQKTAKEGPVVAQIWGKEPDNYRKTAAELVDMGFVGIDINMGCPVKAVVTNGCCSALINNRELAVAIIKATQEGAAGRVPVSVKTRLGFGNVDFSWHELLLQQNLAMLTVHGRTTKELSAVPANWEAIAHVRELRDKLAPETLIVGNGDVMSRSQGEALAKQYQLDGIMIGRGIFQDPFVFAQQSPWPEYTKEQRMALYRHHVELFADTWHDGDRRIATLNKFCKVYINGFDGAKELREQLMAAESTQELLECLTVHSPVVVVDEHDSEIGFAPLSEVWQKGLYHRIVSVHIVDDEGRMLLQQRASHLILYPGCWDQAAGGHVDQGQTYDQAATNELAEELGLRGVDLTVVDTYRANTKDQDRIINQFVRVYSVRVAHDVALQPETNETQQLKWFTPQELQVEIAEHPETFTPGFLNELRQYFPVVD